MIAKAWHPPTTHVPMGGWFMVLPLDVAAHNGTEYAWLVASWVSLLATVFAMFTWLVGFLDASRVAGSEENTREIMGHAALVSLAMVLFGIGATMRMDGLGPGTAPDMVVTVLDGFGLLALAAGGFLGGRLVYENSVGVRPSDGAREV